MSETEIKIRAWDGSKMIPSESLTIYNGRAWDPQWDTELKGYTLMLYSGMKDNSGREIYEKDRVRLDLSMPGTITGEVVMVRGCFYVRLDKPHRFEDGITRSHDYVKVYVLNRAITVIGHAYEHCVKQKSPSCCICNVQQKGLIDYDGEWFCLSCKTHNDIQGDMDAQMGDS